MEPILDVLDSAVHWGDRINAAIALRDFPPSDAGKACLLRNVQAEDYLVRYHSASTLLAWAGVETAIEDDDELFTAAREGRGAGGVGAGRGGAGAALRLSAISRAPELRRAPRIGSTGILVAIGICSTRCYRSRCEKDLCRAPALLGDCLGVVPRSLAPSGRVAWAGVMSNDNASAATRAATP